MSMELNQKALEFIGRPLFAKLATVKKSGAPHVTPVWYTYDEGKFVVNFRGDRLKLKNIANEPRVALLIDDAYSYVLVQGRVATAEGRDPQEDIKALAIRYRGKEEGEKEWQDVYSKQTRVSMTITPQKIITKDI